ncbi:MAG: M20 family metallopeptidase [Candidatus Omnitrophota bacterium]|jgi:succinyl-diaminopimelate desuccinylase
MIKKSRLVALLKKLISINSENPGGNEFRIARFAGDYLSKLGLKIQIYEFKEKRSNLIALLEGKDRKRSLLLTPHLDTVPRGNSWTVDPFGGKVSNGRMYGLGATDRKGDLAAAMEAVTSIVESGRKPDYNLILAATADEEAGSRCGIIPLLEKRILNPDAAVVLDADDFSIVVAQKGLIHLTVSIRGRRAHGAYPWLGDNAIDKAAAAIGEIGKHRFPASPHKYLRPPTVNVGTIRGGDKVNVVADRCDFELDIRFLPGTPAARILSELKVILKKNAGRSYKITINSLQQPYGIELDHPLVDHLRRAMRSRGVRPKVSGSEGATVITFFQERGIPAVATGFGCDRCNHISDEYVEIDNLYKGAGILETFLRDYDFSSAHSIG